MDDVNTESQSRDTSERQTTSMAPSIERPVWEAPKMEDVSEQVMAQPYIRFT